MPRLLPLAAPRLVAPLRPGRGVLGSLVRRARRWPVDSQLPARRNAMVACTALAARRAEREDVEEFLRSPSVAPAAAHG